LILSREPRSRSAERDNNHIGDGDELLLGDGCDAERTQQTAIWSPDTTTEQIDAAKNDKKQSCKRDEGADEGTSTDDTCLGSDAQSLPVHIQDIDDAK